MRPRQHGKEADFHIPERIQEFFQARQAKGNEVPMRSDLWANV